MACTSSKWGKFWLWSSIWPWRSRPIIPQNNRALNQGPSHLWSKFGDPSLKRLMSYRMDKLVIDGHTDTHTQATTIPEGQNWPRVKRGPGRHKEPHHHQSWVVLNYFLSRILHGFSALRLMQCIIHFVKSIISRSMFRCCPHLQNNDWWPTLSREQICFSPPCSMTRTNFMKRWWSKLFWTPRPWQSRAK